MASPCRRWATATTSSSTSCPERPSPTGWSLPAGQHPGLFWYHPPRPRENQPADYCRPLRWTHRGRRRALLPLPRKAAGAPAALQAHPGPHARLEGTGVRQRRRRPDAGDCTGAGAVLADGQHRRGPVSPGARAGDALLRHRHRRQLPRATPTAGGSRPRPRATGGSRGGGWSPGGPCLHQCPLHPGGRAAAASRTDLGRGAVSRAGGGPGPGGAAGGGAALQRGPLRSTRFGRAR